MTVIRPPPLFERWEMGFPGSFHPLGRFAMAFGTIFEVCLCLLESDYCSPKIHRMSKDTVYFHPIYTSLFSLLKSSS
jgi:hypothetical protein